MRAAKDCIVRVWDWRGRLYALPVPAGTDARRVRRMARREMERMRPARAATFLGGQRVPIHKAARWSSRWGIEYS